MPFETSAVVIPTSGKTVMLHYRPRQTLSCNLQHICCCLWKLECFVIQNLVLIQEHMLGESRVHSTLRWGNRIYRDYLKNGRIILKRILNRRGTVDWVYVTQNRVKWRAVVNTVMNFMV